MPAVVRGANLSHEGKVPRERWTLAGTLAMRRKRKEEEPGAWHAQILWSVKGQARPRLVGEEADGEAATCQILREKKALDRTLSCTSLFKCRGGCSE